MQFELHELIAKVRVGQLLKAGETRNGEVVHIGAKTRNERHVLEHGKFRDAIDLAAFLMIEFYPALFEHFFKAGIVVALIVARPALAQEVTQIFIRVDKAKPTRVIFEIEPIGEFCRFTITHERFADSSSSVVEGWGFIASGLKTLLETGKPLDLQLP